MNNPELTATENLPRILSAPTPNGVHPVARSPAAGPPKAVYPIHEAGITGTAQHANLPPSPTVEAPLVSNAVTDDPKTVGLSPAAASQFHSAAEPVDIGAHVAQTAGAASASLEGPGPLDLTLGRDTSTHLWQAVGSPRDAGVAQTAATSRLSPAAANVASQDGADPRLPTDAELDKWVAQQERIEARRERELAKATRSREQQNDWQAEVPFPDDELTTGSSDRPSWMTRMRSLWPFGRPGEDTSEAYDASPTQPQDETARTARRQLSDVPAAGSKWR